MIPPPNYMYQQSHGGTNFPLNRNGYLYPRHCEYIQCTPGIGEVAVVGIINACVPFYVLQSTRFLLWMYRRCRFVTIFRHLQQFRPSEQHRIQPISRSRRVPFRGLHERSKSIHAINLPTTARNNGISPLRLGTATTLRIRVFRTLIRGTIGICTRCRRITICTLIITTPLPEWWVE